MNILNIVLIETLWNVKNDNNVMLDEIDSINRNIVECKGRCIRLVRSV